MASNTSKHIQNAILCLTIFHENHDDRWSGKLLKYLKRNSQGYQLPRDFCTQVETYLKDIKKNTPALQIASPYNVTVFKQAMLAAQLVIKGDTDQIKITLNDIMVIIEDDTKATHSWILRLLFIINITQPGDVLPQEVVQLFQYIIENVIPHVDSDGKYFKIAEIDRVRQFLNQHIHIQKFSFDDVIKPFPSTHKNIKAVLHDLVPTLQSMKTEYKFDDTLWIIQQFINVQYLQRVRIDSIVLGDGLGDEWTPIMEQELQDIVKSFQDRLVPTAQEVYESAISADRNTLFVNLDALPTFIDWKAFWQRVASVTQKNITAFNLTSAQRATPSTLDRDLHQYINSKMIPNHRHAGVTDEPTLIVKKDIKFKAIQKKSDVQVEGQKQKRTQEDVQEEDQTLNQLCNEPAIVNATCNITFWDVVTDDAKLYRLQDWNDIVSQLTQFVRTLLRYNIRVKSFTFTIQIPRPVLQQCELICKKAQTFSVVMSKGVGGGGAWKHSQRDFKFYDFIEK